LIDHEQEIVTIDASESVEQACEVSQGREREDPDEMLLNNPPYLPRRYQERSRKLWGGSIEKEELQQLPARVELDESAESGLGEGENKEGRWASSSNFNLVWWTTSLARSTSHEL